MGNVFETCSLSKKASRSIVEPESLENLGGREKVIEPEAALETHTGKFLHITGPLKLHHDELVKELVYAGKGGTRFQIRV